MPEWISYIRRAYALSTIKLLYPATVYGVENSCGIPATVNYPELQVPAWQLKKLPAKNGINGMNRLNRGVLVGFDQVTGNGTRNYCCT